MELFSFNINIFSIVFHPESVTRWTVHRNAVSRGYLAIELYEPQLRWLSWIPTSQSTRSEDHCSRVATFSRLLLWLFRPASKTGSDDESGILGLTHGFLAFFRIHQIYARSIHLLLLHEREHLPPTRIPLQRI